MALQLFWEALALLPADFLPPCIEWENPFLSPFMDEWPWPFSTTAGKQLTWPLLVLTSRPDVDPFRWTRCPFPALWLGLCFPLLPLFRRRPALGTDPFVKPFLQAAAVSPVFVSVPFLNSTGTPFLVILPPKTDSFSSECKRAGRTSPCMWDRIKKTGGASRLFTRVCVPSTCSCAHAAHKMAARQAVSRERKTTVV